MICPTEIINSLSSSKFKIPSKFLSKSLKFLRYFSCFSTGKYFYLDSSLAYKCCFNSSSTSGVGILGRPYLKLTLRTTASIRCKLYIQMAESRRLYIKVQSYERAPKSTKLYACLYFSIQYRDTEYFSSQIPTGTDTKAIEEMNDHIIFEITDELEWQTLKLTRWEDHLPIFTIELELSEIFARQFSKKRLETKPQ